MVAVMVSAPWSSFAAPSPFLYANGTNICSNYGQGNVVALHGVNFGQLVVNGGVDVSPGFFGFAGSLLGHSNP